MCSLFSSFGGACQSSSFLIQRIRDKHSTRKFDFGVFTQPGSKTEVPGFARHVRFTLRSRHRQPAPACPFGAKAQSRCAPARCAGARAERLVADGEDSDSGVATINSRIVGVQRMIKNSRIICGQHLSRRTTSTRPIMQLQNWLDETRKPVCLNVP